MYRPFAGAEARPVFFHVPIPFGDGSEFRRHTLLFARSREAFICNADQLITIPACSRIYKAAGTAKHIPEHVARQPARLRILRLAWGDRTK